MKVLILNGPNLNLLGQREPEIYGAQTFEVFFESLKTKFPDVELTYLQSNSEGTLLDIIQEYGFVVDGIIINAGGYTHTSIALADAISAITAPVIEVHISNTHARESFRKESYLTPVCKGCILGLGLESYTLALHYFQL